jgi:hypothetical protein
MCGRCGGDSVGCGAYGMAGPISENRRPPSIITVVRVDRLLQSWLISHEAGMLAAQMPESGIHEGNAILSRCPMSTLSLEW